MIVTLTEIHGYHYCLVFTIPNITKDGGKKRLQESRIKKNALHYIFSHGDNYISMSHAGLVAGVYQNIAVYLAH